MHSKKSCVYFVRCGPSNLGSQSNQYNTSHQIFKKRYTTKVLPRTDHYIHTHKLSITQRPHTLPKTITGEPSLIKHKAKWTTRPHTNSNDIQRWHNTTRHLQAKPNNRLLTHAESSLRFTVLFKTGPMSPTPCFCIQRPKIDRMELSYGRERAPRGARDTGPGPGARCRGKKDPF